MHSVEGTLLPRQGGSGETTSEEGVDGIPKATRHLAGKGIFGCGTGPKGRSRECWQCPMSLIFVRCHPWGWSLRR